jgi:hypothetical protein
VREAEMPVALMQEVAQRHGACEDL